MFNLIAYKILLERKKKNNFELSDAPFFVIEKDGHKAYLFGTDHTLDLSTLPIHILKLIKKSDQLFTENSNPTPEEFSVFLNSLRIKNPEENIWHKILTSQQTDLLRKVAIASLDMVAPSRKKENFDILELDHDFLLDMFETFIGTCIESTQVTNCIQENDSIDLRMEAQLIDLFDNKPLGLEPYGLGVKGLPKLDDESIKRLKDEIIPFYDLYIKKDPFVGDEKKQFDLLTKRLAKEHNSEKATYSTNAQLYDYSRANDLDNEITNFDLNMPIRNLHMFNSINSTISKYSLPLYCVGADHLIGSFGLINLLRKNGYTISRVSPTIAPITYSYLLYRESYNLMKRSILQGPDKSNLNNIRF